MFRKDFGGFEFFDLFGNDNLHEDNPLTEFALPPVDTPCAACGLHYAERGDDLCAACVRDLRDVVDGGIARLKLHLANHAAFAEWEASR